jgi:hypothetical protein
MPSDAEGLIEDFGLDAVLRVNPMPRLREFVITVADYGDARVQLSESRQALSKNVLRRRRHQTGRGGGHNREWHNNL